MMTEPPVFLPTDDVAEQQDFDTDRKVHLASNEPGEGWQPPQSRWAWWLMISALAVACTLIVMNWVGWENLPIAARLIVLVELFLVACLVLFLVLGERFSEWAGYGSLWASDEDRRASSREGISRTDRNWSRTAQLKQYLRRTYYEVRCQHSTVLPKEWRRSQPSTVSPKIEQQRQNPPATREAQAIRGMPTITPPVQSPLPVRFVMNPPVLGKPMQAPTMMQSITTIGASEVVSTPPMPTGPKTCRPTSRLEIRRRQ
jgi:hypothetical protein